MHAPSTTTTLNLATAIVAKAEGTNPNKQPDRRIVAAVQRSLDSFAELQGLSPNSLLHTQAHAIVRAYEARGYYAANRAAALEGSGL